MNKRKCSQNDCNLEEITHLTWSLPVPETTVGIMSRSGKRLRTGEEEGEGDEEDGDFDPMAFYRWIWLFPVCLKCNNLI